jgi:hypothetical protein
MAVTFWSKLWFTMVFDLLVKAAERCDLTIRSNAVACLGFDLLVKDAVRALNGMFLGFIAIYMLINVYNMYTLLLCATTQDNGFIEYTYLFMGSEWHAT